MSNTSLLGSYGAQDNSSLLFRNKVINGDMRIDQRNAGAKVTLDSKFGVDRFVQFIASNFFTAGLQQKTDTPPTGFSHYLRVSADTAGTATAGQYAFLAQAIEGFNVSDLAWGTSSATAVSLSFWARSSLTGTFSGSIKNNTEDRSYVFSFSISAANTWEYKTITIPGCPDGTWDKATNAGFRISWDYGSGSARRSTAGAWLSGNFSGATGSVSLSQTLNATLDLTGVQLEAGPTATPFERRPIGTELSLCQRYYEKSYNIDVVPGTASSNFGKFYHLASSDSAGSAGPYIQFKVTKRSTPLFTAYTDLGLAGSWRYLRSGAGADAVVNTPFIGQTGGLAFVNCGASWVPVSVHGHWTASAEL